MFINNGICWGWFSFEFQEALEDNAITFDADDSDIDNQLYDCDCSFCCM